MATTTHIPPNQRISEKHRFSVLEILSSHYCISIEGLLRALPWIRWGELFSILSSLKEEGVVVLDQKGFDFVVRINESCFSGVVFSDQSSCCSNIGQFSNDNNRQLTRS